jgi:hypothetical protein
VQKRRSHHLLGTGLITLPCGFSNHSLILPQRYAPIPQDLTVPPYAMFDMANDWLRGYNEQHPHESLGGLPPSVFREKVTAKSSTLELST